MDKTDIDKLEESGINIDIHMTDGFTLSTIDSTGHLKHKRYIGYDIADAIEDFKSIAKKRKK